MYKTASIEEEWSYLSVRLEHTCHSLDLDLLSVWLQDNLKFNRGEVQEIISCHHKSL